MGKIIYTGVFFDASALYAAMNKHLPRKKLHRQIENPHVTVQYKPRDVNTSLFGQEVEFTVTGYAVDGRNEGVAVQFSKDGLPQVLCELLEGIKVPHITFSVSKDGKPVDTGRLQFHACQPFKIRGTYQPFYAG